MYTFTDACLCNQKIYAPARTALYKLARLALWMGLENALLATLDGCWPTISLSALVSFVFGRLTFTIYTRS